MVFNIYDNYIFQACSETLKNPKMCVEMVNGTNTQTFNAELCSTEPGNEANYKESTTMTTKFKCVPMKSGPYA